MPSISQEDSGNRGKNIENFNEKCTCIYYKCVEYFFFKSKNFVKLCSIFRLDIDFTDWFATNDQINLLSVKLK